ncbi:hypothetical protein J6590_039313 [Homalodisca vitripennis]|nr:hypothetical protein J6590_039313 [Homalodisca vitripennis]
MADAAGRSPSNETNLPVIDKSDRWVTQFTQQVGHLATRRIFLISTNPIDGSLSSRVHCIICPALDLSIQCSDGRRSRPVT